MRNYRATPIDKPVDSGEFVYGWYLEISGRHLIITDKATLVVGNNYWFSLKGFIEVHPSTVGQQVGLKSKHGKEIYEGDDVDVNMSFEGGTLPHRGIVVYDNVFGAFGTKNEAGITLLHNHCLHTLEIIGNIHTENKNGKEENQKEEENHQEESN